MPRIIEAQTSAARFGGVLIQKGGLGRAHVRHETAEPDEAGPRGIRACAPQKGDTAGLFRRADRKELWTRRRRVGLGLALHRLRLYLCGMNRPLSAKFCRTAQ